MEEWILFLFFLYILSFYFIYNQVWHQSVVWLHHTFSFWSMSEAPNMPTVIYYCFLVVEENLFDILYLDLPWALRQPIQNDNFELKMYTWMTIIQLLVCAMSWRSIAPSLFTWFLIAPYTNISSRRLILYERIAAGSPRHGDTHPGQTRVLSELPCDKMP